MKKKRVYNLDLLRIVAMLMIVTLHLLGNKGVLDASITHRSDVAWALETICIVAVNCYVLISGYFLINSKFRISKLMQLVAQVLFYSVFIAVVMVAIGRAEFNLSSIVSTILPTLTGQYWFITAYVGMYVLSPFLNILIQAMNRKQHRALVVTTLLLFAVWPSVFWKITLAYRVEGGYSVVWFVVLYILAAYIGKYYKADYKIKAHIIRYIAAAVFSVALTTLLSYLFHETGRDSFLSLKNSQLLYNSITTLLMSITLFMVFLNIRIRNIRFNRLIAFFAPLTFGVYLIHQHPMLRNLIWSDLFDSTTLDDRHLTVFVLLAVPTIYLIASMIDYGRLRLFIILANWDSFSNSYALAEKKVIALANKAVKNI